MAASRFNERLFTNMRRRVLRRRVPRAELVFGAGFLVFLVLAGFWILAQSDNFDPGERDIDIETLAAGGPPIEVYHRPLERWVEPGTAHAGGPVPIDTGIFPAAIVDGGWDVDGRVEVYDKSNVYEKINGAAEQFIRFGFEKLHYVTLAKDGTYLTIELYDQGGFPGGLGIFSAQRSPDKTVDEEGGIYYYDTSVGVIGLYGQYYFKVAGSEANAAVREKAGTVLASLTKLPASGAATPRAFTALATAFGVELDGIAYESQDVFQYDFLSDFWFASPSELEGGRVFVHEAESAAVAGELFDKLVREQSFEYQELERGAGRVLLRHEYLGDFFYIERHGALLYGVDHAPSGEAASEAARKLGGILVERPEA